MLLSFPLFSLLIRNKREKKRKDRKKGDTFLVRKAYIKRERERERERRKKKRTKKEDGKRGQKKMT